MERELEDWEVLQGSGSNREGNSKSLEEIEDVTQGMIKFDYFSLENKSVVCRVEAGDEDGSVQSGSPGWIEPSSDAPYGPKHFSELWSDSSSDRLDDQRLVDDEDDVNNEFGLENSSSKELDVVEYMKRRFDSEVYKDSIAQENLEKKECFDYIAAMDLKNCDEGTDRDSGELLSENDDEEGEGKIVSINPSVTSGGGRDEKGFVWWKVPIEILKYCVFKVNPIWPFSMAAAFVGFVMLGRRLYNMKKKKSRTLQHKVLLDDKKVVNHVARWNEVISVVKRVPIIRPTLPSSVGVNQWSMMSLR